MFVEFSPRILNIRTRTLSVLLSCSLIAFFMEWALVWKLSRLHMNDCYILLCPCVIFIFALLLRCRVPIAGSLRMRQCSVVIYLSHLIFVSMFEKLLPHHWLLNIPLFCLTLLCSMLTYIFLSYVRSKSAVPFLRWSY